MTTEESVLRLENAFATLEELAASAQSNTEKLTGLVAQEKRIPPPAWKRI